MKKFLIPLLAALAIPTAVNANVDPKIVEICMKAADFKGCVESISGQENNNSSIKYCSDSNFGKVCLSNDGLSLYNNNTDGKLVSEQALTEPSILTQPTVVTNPPTQVVTTRQQATQINQ